MKVAIDKDHGSSNDEPTWQQELELGALTLPQVQIETGAKSFWWDAVTAKLGDLGKTIEIKTTNAGEAIGSTTRKTEELLGNTALYSPHLSSI